MIQVYSNLFIGDDKDYEDGVSHIGFAIVHAAKEPHHRSLLGYTTKGAPKDHPEYLWARRGNILYLNLVDTDMMEFIPPEVIDAALDFIDEQLKSGRKVLVHCNKGESRAPSIGLLYLKKIGVLQHIDEFRVIYPPYNPKKGFIDYINLL